jgi:alkylated DNA nucleotide flippase Atl1
VKAGETTFQRLVEGEKQFVVPLYQRPYGWQREQLARLWEDVLEQADSLESGSSSPRHFLGSVVLAPEETNAASGLGRWVVVDGQQRLTTLMLLLTSLRDHVAHEAGEAERLEEQFLVNKWRHGEDRYRLLPTQADREAYVACVDRLPTAGGAGAVGEAYRFFCSALVEADDPADPHDIARIEAVVRERLTLVEITSERGDNVFRIFESLNNTGMALAQADLVRNEIFMRLPTTADAVYTQLWLPMQERLGRDSLELLMYLDLVLEGEDRARRDDLYRRHRERLASLPAGDEAAVRAYVERLARRGKLTAILVTPELEPVVEIRDALARLADWGRGVANPSLLALLERRRDGHLSDADLGTSLAFIESFLVRRMLSGVTSANLNRIFQTMVARIAEAAADIPATVRTFLSGTRLYWPSDGELREAMQSRPFYWTGRPGQRMFVLRRLEETFPSAERADLSNTALSIEHVLPQSLPAEWLASIADECDGEDPMAVAERLLHTIGNLTLTGYNAQLSNAPFATKRKLLLNSNLEMNRPIAALEHWGPKAIAARADDLASRAIQIWPGPDLSARAEGGPGRDWTALLRALAAMPPGTWTTYGDIAELIGSHPVPVGAFIANSAVPNGWRVLTKDGAVSSGFHWNDPSDTRDPIDVLSSEGVVFNEAGRASPSQRLSASELHSLVDPTSEIPAMAENDDAAEIGTADRFMLQVGNAHGPACAGAVAGLIDLWEGLDGDMSYGTANVTSAHFTLKRPNGTIWPLSVYPGSSVEVVFYYLKTRPPFDSVALRDELRQRLNKSPDIEIPRGKLELRPSFPVELLIEPETRLIIEDTLVWFAETVRADSATQSSG